MDSVLPKSLNPDEDGPAVDVTLTKAVSGQRRHYTPPVYPHHGAHTTPRSLSHR
jgi:hypothetical protein